MRFFKGDKKVFGEYCDKFKEEIDQFKNLGYYHFQIKEILSSVVSKKELKKLSDSDIDSVRSTLKEHIAFAQKALKVSSK